MSTLDSGGSSSEKGPGFGIQAYAPGSEKMRESSGDSNLVLVRRLPCVSCAFAACIWRGRFAQGGFPDHALPFYQNNS